MMKKLEEMNTQELAELDEAGIDKLVQFEAASEGLKFAARPLELQVKRPSIERKMEGYKVGDIIFERQEDALAVAKMPRFKEGYDYRSGYSLRWLEASEDTEVKTVVYYEKADVMANVSELRQMEEDKKAAEDAMKAYQSYQEGLAAIRSDIWSKVFSAKRKAYEVEQAKAKFEEFKVLADGNEETAERFFIKAMSGNEEILEAVLGKHWNVKQANSNPKDALALSAKED